MALRAAALPLGPGAARGGQNRGFPSARPGVQFPTLQPAAGLALGLVVAVGPLRVGRSRGGPLEPLRPVDLVGGVAGVEQLGFVSHSAAALHQGLVRGQQVEDAVPLVGPSAPATRLARSPTPGRPAAYQA